MPMIFLFVGVLFLVAAVRGTQAELFATLRDDFTGPNNFIIWGVAIFAIIAVGYWKPIRPISNAFLVLVLIVIFLSNGGFFNKFMEQVGQTQHPAPNPSPQQTASHHGGGILGTIRGVLDTAQGLAGTAAKVAQVAAVAA